MRRSLTRHQSARFVRVAGVAVQTVAEGIVVLHPAARVGTAQTRTRVDTLLSDARLAGGTLGVCDALGPAAGHGVALVAGQARADGHVTGVLALGVGAARRGKARVGRYRVLWRCCGRRQRVGQCCCR